MLPPLAFLDGEWLSQALRAFSDRFPPNTFFAEPANLRALIALVLVSLCCGSVGSLVVGGRMSFFSDALAHCAFAGVCLGFLLYSLCAPASTPDQAHTQFWRWVTPVMIAFGALIGCGIAYVRGETGLASDTVIGVFFAGAIGLAAALQKLLRSKALFSLEEFLFGNPLAVTAGDLVALALLLLATVAVLFWIYNPLLLGSFNTSLALSRRLPVRLVNYVFVVLLAVIINLTLRCVGALLINALMIVPAAAAFNLARNQRQVFWLTVFLGLAVSLLGQFLSWEAYARSGGRLDLGVSGTIVLLSVVLFALSLPVVWYRRRKGT
jgi:zinc transport system permease protein